MTRRPVEPEPPHYRIDGPYAGAAPYLYDPADCPWTRTLEAAWRDVRDELDAYRARSGDALTAPRVPTGDVIRGWRSVNLLTYGWRHHASCRHFPRTLELLEGIPGLVSAYLNLLEPRSALPAHHGESNATWRCHLGLRVPSRTEACVLQVGPERTGWREGGTFVFCDAHEHRVWNDSDEERIALVCDVVRPEYAHRTRQICGRVLAAYALAGARSRWRPVAALPPALLRPLHRALGSAVGACLPLQNRLGRGLQARRRNSAKTGR